MSNAGLFDRRASTRTSGRAIHRSCSRGSRAFRPSRDAVWDCGCGSGQASVRARRTFRGGSCHRRGARADRRGEASSARALLGGAGRTQSGLPTRLGGSGDRGAGAALVRRATRSTPRRGACRAPGALLAVWNYPRPQFVDARARPPFLRVLLAMWSGRTGRRSGGTSSRATRRCRFRSRRCAAAGFGARTRAGISSRCWAT